MDAILAGEPPSLANVPNTPAGSYAGGLWADSAEQFFVVNHVGHIIGYDGAYSTLAELDGATSEVRFERDGERLYFLNDVTFGFIEDDEVTLAAKLPESGPFHFTELATHESEGAFVSLVDKSLEPYACGSHVILAFDGSKFHRF